MEKSFYGLHKYLVYARLHWCGCRCSSAALPRELCKKMQKKKCMNFVNDMASSQLDNNEKKQGPHLRPNCAIGSVWECARACTHFKFPKRPWARTALWMHWIWALPKTHPNYAVLILVLFLLLGGPANGQMRLQLRRLNRFHPSELKGVDSFLHNFVDIKFEL